MSRSLCTFFGSIGQWGKQFSLHQIRVNNPTEFFLQYWTNQIIIFVFFKDSEDESDIFEQNFSQMRFWTEKDRKYFEKSKTEREKLWSSAHDISTDDARSSLQGIVLIQ